jgi:hypothetical protein
LKLFFKPFKRGSHKLCFLFFFVFVICLHNFATANDTLQIRKPKQFVVNGLGMNYSQLRDYGTSPLVYSALLPMVNLGYERFAQKSIYQFNICGATGVYQKKVFQNPFEIKTFGFEVKLNYLWLVSSHASKNIQWYLGSTLIHQLSIRNAEHFQNSGFTVDNISHLGPQLLFQKLIHRKVFEKKIGKITFRRPERNFLFHFGFRLPVISSFYRPGYVFIANGTREDYKTFEQYSLHFLSFRGLFFNTSITRLMRNGNGFRISYDWSAVTTGNKLANRLEMSNHFLQCSLLFKINSGQ